MHIPDYRIYNVLKNYTSDLFRKQSTVKYNKFADKTLSNKVKIFSEERERAVIKRVSDDIIKKIIRSESQNSAQEKNRLQKPVESTKNKETSFVFNVIDKNNRKTTDILSMENPDVFICALRSDFIKDKDKK